MVEYLSGGRIQGSSTLITSPPATSWKELARASLSSAGDIINSGTFTAKDNIMVLQHNINSGSVRTGLRLNADTGNNYAHRRSVNGASDATNTSHNRIVSDTDIDGSDFTVSEFNNISAQEKLGILHRVHQSGSGAGNAPEREEMIGKWVNTSSRITSIQSVNTETGDFDTGSEILVLGYDDDESDSGTPFWQELADVELSSAGDTLNSGIFTAKKYLWIQAFIPEGAAHHGYIYFNNDTGANYSRRGSINGGSDITTAPDNEINWSHATNSAKYLNMFVINKSDKEKLCIAEYMDYNSAGAGNAPNRIEWVYKWANTSAQISSVKLYNQENSSTDFPSGTLLKVWGAD